MSPFQGEGRRSESGLPLMNAKQMQEKAKNIPTAFVIFGATGDLMVKKITPALFQLFNKGKLPNMFQIVAFSRRDWDTEQFQNHVRKILSEHKNRQHKAEDVEKFVKYFVYKKGDFEESDSYVRLSEYLGRVDGEWKVCSNKLFYLAVPPKNYETIFKHLADSGLTLPCGPDEGWTRVIVEKPFGRDLETAQKLDLLLGSLFKEEQIYRIDHYLGKEMVQNILSFRFHNDLFEDLWGKNNIEKVEIKLLEEMGVDNRGDFYDGIGALRDFGQNHALQLLALLTMDAPHDFTAESVRENRAKILKTLVPLTLEQVKTSTFRGQYEGYTTVEGVSPNSTTETYFKIIADLSSGRWKDVPIILESGKKTEQRKEIIVTFKHRIPCLCPEGTHYKNKIVFSLEPKEGIIIDFWSKKPGLDFEMHKQKLSFLFRDQRKKSQYIEEYEKLLLDCILGNQLLFVSTEEVKAMWNFIDSIASAWDKEAVPLVKYKPGKKVLVESGGKPALK